MENNKNQEKKGYNKWLALINIPVQMGVIIFAFYKLGFWLDEKYPSEKLNTTTLGKALKILGFIKVSDKQPGYDYSVKGYYVKVKNTY